MSSDILAHSSSHQLNRTHGSPQQLAPSATREILSLLYVIFSRDTSIQSQSQHHLHRRCIPGWRRVLDIYLTCAPIPHGRCARSPKARWCSPGWGPISERTVDSQRPDARLSSRYSRMYVDIPRHARPFNLTSTQIRCHRSVIDPAFCLSVHRRGPPPAATHEEKFTVHHWRIIDPSSFRPRIIIRSHHCANGGRYCVQSQPYPPHSRRQWPVYSHTARPAVESPSARHIYTYVSHRIAAGSSTVCDRHIVIHTYVGIRPGDTRFIPSWSFSGGVLSITRPRAR
jgi:hypothetical protein